MIAVGGAGSSGSPALPSGTSTITTISTANAINAATNGGVHFTSVTSCPVPTSPAITSPHSASPAINPDATGTTSSSQLRARGHPAARFAAQPLNVSETYFF